MIDEILAVKEELKLGFKHNKIEMSHGAGGKTMYQFIEKTFLRAFSNKWLLQRNDQASIEIPKGKIAISTDSHVVSPLFFPGGNLGSFSVYGIVNDIAMGGGKPLYMSASFILEEGFSLSELKLIVNSMANAAKAAGVSIVAGDTKVVEKGKGDGIFITTTGVGIVPPTVKITHRIQPGDKIIVSGFMGDHGIAVMSKRENLQFQTQVTSDSCPLHDLVAKMLEAVPDIHCLRDPTRGGLAATLNEWAIQHRIGFYIEENAVPMRDAVLGACELLGLDPLYVANEGKLVAICAPEVAEKLISIMHEHPYGKYAAIIGEAVEDAEHFVQMRTIFGGTRIVDWLSGEQLPRIC